MDCSYYVYMHQDKDGKVFYIGKGKVSGTGRVYRHLTWGMRNDDWKTIATKGYTSQVLTYGSERDMLYLEHFLIKSLSDSGLKLVNKTYNENWTPCWTGKKLSEETKQKMSDARSGKKHYMFGKKHSKKTKQKMSDAKSGENNPMFGKAQSEEAKRKISKAKTGVPNITWRNDKSTDLYKQKRKQQRRDFYKQKEVS